jgi:hypothetical protein
MCNIVFTRRICIKLYNQLIWFTNIHSTCTLHISEQLAVLWGLHFCLKQDLLLECIAEFSETCKSNVGCDNSDVSYPCSDIFTGSFELCVPGVFFPWFVCSRRILETCNKISSLSYSVFCFKGSGRKFAVPISVPRRNMIFMELHHLYLSANIIRLMKPRRKGRACCGNGKNFAKDCSVEIWRKGNIWRFMCKWKNLNYQEVLARTNHLLSFNYNSITCCRYEEPQYIRLMKSIKEYNLRGCSFGTDLRSKPLWLLQEQYYKGE